MAKSLKGTWGFPTRVLSGPGRLSDIGRALKSVNGRFPLIVTDAGLKDHEMITVLQGHLKEAGFQSTVFAAVKGNPVGQNVDDGVAVYRSDDHNSVIALGGGSALDAGKAIALLCGQTRPLWDFEEKPGNWKRADSEAIPPIIAVPTTAGTGSEVGRSAVIVDEAHDRKVILYHPKLMPETVIADPELTLGLPPAMTAATGLDAFTHCLEAYCVPSFHPMADGIALNGMAMIQRALPAAYDDGSNLEARAEMLAAASMGAVAFQKGLGGLHAIAHSVGALYDTHHGLTNAVLLPYVFKRNEAAIADKMEPLGRLLGLPRPDYSGVLDFILGFRERLGIPDTLADLSVPADQSERIGDMAISDNCALGNPVRLEALDYAEIFVQAVEGRY